MSDEQNITNKFLEFISLLLMVLVSLFIASLFGGWIGFFSFIGMGIVLLKWLWS
ncbi:hypothetical protein N9H74_06165 [Hyphomicrobiales bacterium]|nr:hypothetical protein [Hyphomicrobiales bacterium]